MLSEAIISLTEIGGYQIQSKLITSPELVSESYFCGAGYLYGGFITFSIAFFAQRVRRIQTHISNSIEPETKT